MDEDGRAGQAGGARPARDAARAAERLDHAGTVLRATWEVPRDTFITDDLPTLLSRLSLPPRG
jgi:hypothetical protein